VHVGFWWGNLSEGGHLQNLGIDGNILKCILKRWVEWGGGGGAWTGIIWHRKVTGDGLLCNAVTNPQVR
jgi:hypothetical protein